jgi:excinuclease ABC subunit A
MRKLVLRGAREHNLKNIDMELPHRKIIAVTGVSGSGKSSLAFDTIYAEGQRRYIESLSTYARQFIEKLDRPDLDSIEGISPTIAIRQKNTVTSARSTVGTATEIYDYLRLLYARAGRTHCPDCGIEVRAWTPTDVANEALSRFKGRRIFLLMPAGLEGAGDWESRKSYLLARGYTRLHVGEDVLWVEDFSPPRSSALEADILIDRVKVSKSSRTRIAEGVETAYSEHEGTVDILEPESGERVSYSLAPSCGSCGRVFAQPAPLLFSFNSPYGACPECKGFGDRMEFAEEMIVPDTDKTLKARAIDPWARERFEFFHGKMLEFCRREGIPVDVPWRELAGKTRETILEGEGEYGGVIPFLERMKEKSYKKGHRFFTRRYMGYTTCRACQGSRLREEARFVLVGDRSISDLSSMVPEEILGTLRNAGFTERERAIAWDILSELESRLGFLVDVGLGYLTLNRLTRTLSGGEAQRINLANSLGANLVDTLYVLDEPSVGLHAADNSRLIEVMERLRNLGNTVIVVEHDPEIIRSSDHLLDLGPGPGEKGGRILFNGPVSKAESAASSTPEGESVTLELIFGDGERISMKEKVRGATGSILLSGVNEHNMKNADVTFPLGNLVCVTGVSGSGKSTLVVDVLYRLLGRKSPAQGSPGLSGWNLDGEVDRILLIDQSPIGATPRSNPITYIKGFSFIRELFASQRKSLVRGYKAGRFSFNKAGGRCARCDGMGYKRVEMHFMADVFVPCDECSGKRYNHETLEVEYRGKSIADVLDMTVDEAILFFDEVPQLGEKLWVLSKTGLGYLRLGQPSNTLSGGEAQRIKIARELAESGGLSNLYIMDEPTTGLHVSDVDRLLAVLDNLVDEGHSVITIEHNMDVIARADHIIDLGPGGGEEGGRVIACGNPRSVLKSKRSVTGRYLKEYLSKFGGRDK